MGLGGMGWDWEAISFWGIIIFAIIGSWGLWKQSQKIWKEKSGKSVSVTANFFFTASMFVGLAYGLEKNLDAVTFHNLLRIVFLLPIVAGLIKFKKFTKTEKILCACFCIMMLLVWFVPRKDFLFLFSQTVGVLTLATQPYEIFKNKDVGVVEVKLFAVFTPSSIFWVIYAFANGDWILKITQPVFLFLTLITLALCLNPKYKKPK